VLYGPPAATGAHRYWRVYTYNTTPSNGGPYIAEYQFREVAGTPQTFSGGTISASTVGNGAAANAADGNVATYWGGSGALPNWWAYDYGPGVTKTIVEVAITKENSQNFNTNNFDIQYSDDAITWQTVANYTCGPWTIPSNQTQLFDVSARPNTAGSPGSALVAAGPEVVGMTSGATLTAPFSAGQALTAGTTYAIGFITDTSVALSEVDAGTTGIKVANTYAGGAPATLPTPTTGNPSWQLWGNCTGAAANWASLSSNPPIDDIAYVTSSTVGQEDLYSFAPLSSAPAAVHAVAVKARVKRSDSGTRTVDVRAASAGVDSAGSASGFTPGTSFGWVDSYFPLDPATGIAWTGTGVNALTAGIKVAS
jgi:hypothetical protein